MCLTAVYVQKILPDLIFFSSSSWFSYFLSWDGLYPNFKYTFSLGQCNTYENHVRVYQLLPSWHLLSPSASHRSVWSGWDHSLATVTASLWGIHFTPVSFSPTFTLIPGPCPGSYVLSSHVFWGSSGYWGWYLRYLMLSHHLSEIMIFREDSSSEAPHLPHEAIASPVTSHWQTHLGGSEDMSACSPIWGPPATRLSYTIWQRVLCAVSIQEEGSYETPKTEITLLRRNTLTAVRMHTDSVQP